MEEKLKFYIVTDEYIKYLIDFVKSLSLKIGTKFDIRKAELLYEKTK